MEQFAYRGEEIAPKSSFGTSFLEQFAKGQFSPLIHLRNAVEDIFVGDLQYVRIQSTSKIGTVVSGNVESSMRGVSVSDRTAFCQTGKGQQYSKGMDSGIIRWMINRSE